VARRRVAISIAAIPFVLAALSGLVYVAQGGFGAGGRRFDAALVILGLPWTALNIIAVDVLGIPEPRFNSEYEWAWLIVTPLGMNLVCAAVASAVVIRRNVRRTRGFIASTPTADGDRNRRGAIAAGAAMGLCVMYWAGPILALANWVPEDGRALTAWFAVLYCVLPVIGGYIASLVDKRGRWPRGVRVLQWMALCLVIVSILHLAFRPR
jgi:hypothetical protein